MTHRADVRLRFCAATNPSVPTRSDDALASFVPMDAVGESGTIDVSQARRVAEVRQGYTAFVDGDVLVAKITPCFENGKGAVARGLINGIGYGTTELYVLRPSKRVDSRWLFYVTASPRFRTAGEAAMCGAAGQKRVPLSFIQNYRVTPPALAQQRAVADYLDQKLKVVDDAIQKKKQLVQLLEDERHASISHAVTMGLGPRRPLKNTTVAWLPMIPEHWKVVRVRHLANRIQTGTTPPTNLPVYFRDGTVPWYAPGSMGRDLDIGAPSALMSLLALKHGKLQWAQAGSTVVTTIGATMGRAAQLPLGGTMNQQLTAITFDAQRLLPRFGSYYFRSLERVLPELVMYTTLPIMNQRQLGSIPVPVPPVVEQQQIVRDLDVQGEKNRAIRRLVEKQICDLLEYRQAAISAAIGGELNIAASEAS
jgi:type I restriction enzyme, S subunit